ncbi:MAG: Holliday junction branch migration protein RuvA [Desulfuromonas sp.]|nr:MAG: Holliday junction branch migration protein RuvA [Desulfuromonas sp.]
MIALLKGEIAYKSIDHVILDVNGVGYRLMIPLSSYYNLPEDGPVRMFVHTHVRDDAIQLFGFLTAEEKQIFITLISVSGVGPKLAINILSHIPATELAEALAGEDTKKLSGLPGIGKKTAERLVLELKDKVEAPAASTGGDESPLPRKHGQDDLNDLISALINLGYKETVAKKAVESMELSPEASLEEALKAALNLLGK